MHTYKAKQYLVATLKVVVLFAGLYFIYNRLVTNGSLSFEQLQEKMLAANLFNFSTLTILILLSVLNWLFEIFKWKYLAKMLLPISFSESSKHVLMAQTLSLFTPFKIGEYGAKTIFFRKKQAKKVVFLNFLGNMAQLAATLFFGIIGFAVYVFLNFPEKLFLFSVLVLAVILCLIFLKTFIKKINFSIGSFNFQQVLHFSKKMPQKTKRAIVGFAFLRYVVFSLQFYFLLHCFFSVTMAEVLPLIAVYYLISSALPVVQFFDVVIKGSVAVFLFSGFPEIILLTITTTMWLLNAVLPAVAGAYFVLTFNAKPLLITQKI